MCAAMHEIDRRKLTIASRQLNSRVSLEPLVTFRRVLGRWDPEPEDRHRLKWVKPTLGIARMYNTYMSAFYLQPIELNTTNCIFISVFHQRSVSLPQSQHK